MIYTFCFGLLLGALIINIYLKDEQKDNELLRKTNHELGDALDSANSRVENRDNLIKDLQEEQEILLDNASEQRIKTNILDEIIKELDSNHFTYDQIDKLKELVRPLKQN